ncbi:hypothetical protein [Cysteiniphilum marinum]|uniref:hypothetical protein n=1 Tax=Cysteiniphilum marinum TaxID=2774191 RepID=UPI00193BACE6|nr:hypothetical protein [Cysteiniphilum marinum]
MLNLNKTTKHAVGADGRNQQANKVSLADFERLNHIKNECEKIFYTPKSKFHVDFLWLSQWLKHLNCPRQAILLLQVLYFSHKDGSVFVNGLGENYQGMLINFNALEERLGFSRKVCLSAFKKLEEQGLIVRITLKNNRILYQSTNKANNLLNDLHNYSLAANTSENDYAKVSQNFDTVSVSVPSYSQRDKQAFTFGNSSINKVNNQKVNKKNNNQYNPNQESKNVGATENFDCDKTVIFCDFDFSEFGIGAVKCESSLFDYFTVSQAKAINTITHVKADNIDIIAFNNALSRKDIKREAQDFKQFVDWCYLVAVDAKSASAAKGSVTVSDCDLAESVVVSGSVNLGKVDHLSEKKADKNSNINRQTKLDLDAVINELKAMLADQSLEAITAKVLELNSQYDIDSENELVAAVLVEFGLISEDDFLGGDFAASDLRNALPNQSLTSKEADNTNNASIVKGDNANNLVVDQAHYSEKNAESVTFVDGDSETGIASDLRNIGLKRSLTTENNTNALNVVVEDNADNNRFDQVNDSGNFESVIDGVGFGEGESVGVSDVEVVDFGGDGKGQCRDSRETVANDNDYQQNTSADKIDKENKIVVDQFLNLGKSKYKDFVKLCLQRGFPSETKIIESAKRAIRDYGKLNFDQLFRGICYGDFYGLKLVNSEAVTEIDTDNKEDQKNKKDQSQTKAKNPLSNNPTLNLPTLSDLIMPVVEKEVLKKDWASLAEQSLGLVTVTECQKVALVAIIDYVKRKGVVITSDQEVYEWLYHTVANYEYYFSGATNFKHLANILIKRLVNKSFNRPSGFDTWRKMIGDGERVVSMDTDKKTNKKDLKNYSSEIDLLLGRINDKMNVTNPKKDVKKHQKKLYSNRRTGGFVV